MRSELFFENKKRFSLFFRKTKKALNVALSRSLKSILEVAHVWLARGADVRYINLQGRRPSFFIQARSRSVPRLWMLKPCGVCVCVAGLNSHDGCRMLDRNSCTRCNCRAAPDKFQITQQEAHVLNNCTSWLYMDLVAFGFFLSSTSLEWCSKTLALHSACAVCSIPKLHVRHQRFRERPVIQQMTWSTSKSLVLRLMSIPLQRARI